MNARYPAVLLALLGALTLAGAGALAQNSGATGARSNTSTNRAGGVVSCDPGLLAGDWVNAGKEYKGVGVALSVEGGSGWAQGQFSSKVKPNNVWPTTMLRAIAIDGSTPPPVDMPPGQCLFKSRCQETSGSPTVCWAQYDMAARTLRISYTLGPRGVVGARESAPWSRPAAPVAVRTAPATCKPTDLAGAWYRADGVSIELFQIEGSPGLARHMVYPRGWPRGIHRYTAITPVGNCSWQAVCTEIQRVGGGDGEIRRADATCTLNYDPVKGVMTQVGGSTWTRQRSTTAEAEATRKADEEAFANYAASEDLNAEVTRRNAEAAARDQAKKDAFARQQREYEAKKRADAAAYARAQAEYERKKAEVEAKRQQDLRDWEARVAACKAGDKTQCAPG